jgi:hypothetical protein
MAPPYRGVLKMRMSFGGSGFIGSAFIIGKRAVLTAGHCVFDNGFSNNIQFIPQYNNGSAPFGEFTATQVTTLKEYTELPSFDGRKYFFDIGACVVDRDFPAELVPVSYSVDHVLQSGKLRSVGYPGEPAPGFNFNGEVMWTSLGDYWNEGDQGGGTTAARNYGHYNDMTGGCSGGPIFTGDGESSVVVGLNSHVILQDNGSREQPPRMYAPYFNADLITRLTNWLTEKGGQPLPPVNPGSGTVPPIVSPPPVTNPNIAEAKARLQQAAALLNEAIARL